MNGELRTSQIVTTFGPGSMVDLPDSSVIVSGLDHWEYDKTKDIPIVDEPRLVEKIRSLLGMPQLTLRKPPPSLDRGQHGFHPIITGWRFPEWFISQKTENTARGFRRRRLVHWNQLENGRFLDEEDKKKYPVVPVRFVRACKKGHVGDIDWPAFVHGKDAPSGGELWIEERGTTGDLDEVWIVSSSGAQRPVAQAARLELQALGRCNGNRPWLGPGKKEKCGEINRLLVRSASNAYFPQLLSVISIPDQKNPIDDVVRSAWNVGLAIVDEKSKLAMIRSIPAVADKLQGIDDDAVWESIQRIRSGANRTLLPVKEAEFDVLSSAVDELTTDEPEGDFYARSLPPSHWNAPWMAGIEKVVLVHRLREVVAQIGFTRFEASGTDIQGELDIDVQRAPLALDTSWLPALENRGEGIFIQFKSSEIQKWVEKPAVMRRAEELLAGFDVWKKGHEESTREFPGMPYILLHSLSHLLLTAISLECGYPASSLRERIYAIPQVAANSPGYGILIYTGSSDAEGTLGGLILTAREIKHHLKRALRMALLCSNDPVCANHQPGHSSHQPLSGAACHSCLYVAETSCEQRNEFLDRTLVVETVEQIGAAFFEGFK